MIDTAMRQPANILIVGAGPAGLALALTLRRQGHAPQLIERAHRFPAGGAGIYLVGNGTRALRSLGLADAAVDAGYTIPAQHFCDHHGTLLAGVDVAAYWNGCGPCLGLRRSELLRVLADPLADAPIRWNTTLRSLQLADGRVALRFSDGTAGEFDLVVGADGIHSSIRDFLYGAAPPAYRGQIAWRFLAPGRPPSTAGPCFSARVQPFCWCRSTRRRSIVTPICAAICARRGWRQCDTGSAARAVSGATPHRCRRCWPACPRVSRSPACRSRPCRRAGAAAMSC